jgi:hypothetical protein
MVAWVSPGTTVIPPTGGSGLVEDPPPQAVKISAAAKAIKETRIECNNMNFFLCGTCRPQILSDFTGDIANTRV